MGADVKLGPVRWVFEPDIFGENLKEMQDAVVAQGMDYKVVPYKPFGAMAEVNPLTYCWDMVEEPASITKHPCVFYGSLNMAAALNPSYGNFTPRVYCDLSKFKCTNYYTYLGKYLLNSNYWMMPLGEFERRFDSLILPCFNDTLFIRPSSGFKTFSGQTVTKQTFDKDMRLVRFDENVKSGTMVVVSQPKNIMEEWRIVVVDGKAVAGSMYKMRGRTMYSKVVPDAAFDFAEQVASTWSPEPAFTIDVCYDDGDFRLIEINSFSCSGLYACDKHAVVKAVSALVQREYNEYNKYRGV